MTASVALTRLGRAVDDLELVEAPARSDRHAGKRRLGQVDRDQGLLSQPDVEASLTVDSVDMVIKEASATGN